MKKVAITIAEEDHKEALHISKVILGKENLSGIIRYLIKQEINHARYNKDKVR